MLTVPAPAWLVALLDLS